MNKVIDRIFIGNQLDANYWNTSENGIEAVLDLRWLDIDLEVTDETLEQVDLAIKILDVMYATGKNVLVHCMAGIDRAPFIVALWMSKKLGMDIRESYNIVKEKRPETFQHWEWAIAFDKKWDKRSEVIPV